jgi:hypothetical protein
MRLEHIEQLANELVEIQLELASKVQEACESDEEADAVMKRFNELLDERMAVEQAGMDAE